MHQRQAARPIVGGGESLVLMQIMEAIYKSADSGKSVEIRFSGGMQEKREHHESAPIDTNPPE